MATIFHLALAEDWAAAQASGAYTTSTRGRTLAEEGFIHASRGDQWPAIRDACYADVPPGELVLLQVDTDRLDVPVVEEPAAPGATETFPHIYGPLRVGAVVKAIPLAARAGVGVSTSSTTREDPPAQSARPTESFSRLYFREVFFNVAILCLVMAAGAAGLVLGGLVDDQRGPGIGGLVGLAAGVVVAVRLYRRRHRAVTPPSAASSS